MTDFPAVMRAFDDEGVRFVIGVWGANIYAGGAVFLTKDQDLFGFPLAFANAELSPHGLLPSLARAREVQAALRRHYPDQHHAQCHVWAVFRALDPR